MARTALALQVTAPGSFGIIEVPVPSPAPDEVLVEVKACATCTNWELKTWRGVDIFSRPGHPIYPQNPGSPGHEAAGVVVETGPEVTELGVGDHVAVYGSTRGPENDAHAQYIVRPACQVAKVDPAIPFEEAAPLEMALCAVRSVDLAGNLVGRTVAVVGLGPAGILHLQVAKARGAAELIGIDVLDARLAAARPFADAAVDGRDREALQTVREQGADIVFECSGSPQGMRTALDIARECCLVFAVPEGTVEWGKWEWLRSVSIAPYHWRGDTQVSCLRRAADMLARGELNTRAVVSAVLPYPRYAEGLAMLEAREAVKIVYSGWS